LELQVFEVVGGQSADLDDPKSEAMETGNETDHSRLIPQRSIQHRRRSLDAHGEVVELRLRSRAASGIPRTARALRGGLSVAGTDADPVATRAGSAA
jgi:hypothetical protein